MNSFAAIAYLMSSKKFKYILGALIDPIIPSKFVMCYFQISQDLHIIFVDLKQTYDKIPREII